MELLRAIVNCQQIVTISSNGDQFRVGPDQDRVDIIERRSDGIGGAIVFGHNGQIVAVGHDDTVLKQLNSQFNVSSFDQIDHVIDGEGCSLIPGLIDAHTHPVWAGDRVNEFDLKLRGASYLEIHQSGGGIQYTVEQTEKATEDELTQSLLERIDKVSACGTTVLECKTGYGLALNTELKMLRVIERARKQTPIELVTTFLGAHSVPKGMTPEQGVENVIDMMDQISKMDEKFSVEFIDVFCEKGVYDLKQTETILKHGLKTFSGSEIAFHGDELCDLGAGVLAGQMGARSVSHLEYANQQSVAQMAKEKVAAIMCPTTCFLLRLPVPPVRSMIQSGVPVVIASDYNPNAMCYSLPMAMNLAAIHYGMTLNECLIAVTINAAYALKRSQTHGTLEVGKRADCILLNVPDWRNLIYQFGETSPLIRCVIKSGYVVHGKV
ncbi:hypothetical protein RDWZM_007649 [Blomia tropicalis]|uniref:Probable imidazolonepropionase n=1 Tax=Blomia tropicalis TaxID=40697 RepID=A0A9Q0M206_BLOTA|nr:hypothetical protein RDWZM_007649 [Blomia tropicalis]